MFECYLLSGYNMTAQGWRQENNSNSTEQVGQQPDEDKLKQTAIPDEVSVQYTDICNNICLKKRAIKKS